MIFDTLDYEVLKLTGFCRYMPIGLAGRYDTTMFNRGAILNLQEHGLIKMQSNKLSFKLTKKGHDVLAEMGESFPEDARMDLKKPSYKRKLANAQWNVLLNLAGINVFYMKPHELADISIGYVSSLTQRADKNMKVLAGSRFLGILKIADTAYIPYYIENEDAWIIPQYEKEMYEAQLKAIPKIKDQCFILTGKSLEELWRYIYPVRQCDNLTRGMKRFGKALKELGIDFMLVPFGRNGVIQMQILKICRYREKIARAIGCSQSEYSQKMGCDGVIDNIPHIVAVDLNIRRIVEILKQLQDSNIKAVPRICCLSFQKDTVFEILKKYDCPKCAVITIDASDVTEIFPELKADTLNRKPYLIKPDKYLEVTPKENIKDED